MVLNEICNSESGSTVRPFSGARAVAESRCVSPRIRSAQRICQ
jgi:hypothetical protein